MASRRKIIIYSQATSQSKEIESDATTWGQLKKAVEEAIMNSVTTVKAVVRETRNTLDNDDAVLPSGEFTIFLLPVKVKSGVQARRKDGKFGGKAKTSKKEKVAPKKAKKAKHPRIIVKKKKIVQTVAKDPTLMKVEADRLKKEYNGSLTVPDNNH